MSKAKKPPLGPVVMMDRVTVLKWLAQQNQVNRDLEAILTDVTRQTLRYRLMMRKLKWTVKPRRFRLVKNKVTNAS